METEVNDRRVKAPVEGQPMRAVFINYSGIQTKWDKQFQPSRMISGNKKMLPPTPLGQV